MKPPLPARLAARAGRGANAAPWALSLCLHAAIITAAALVITHRVAIPAAPSASISFADDQSATLPSAPAPRPAEPPPEQPRPAALTPAPTPLAQAEPVPLVPFAPPEATSVSIAPPSIDVPAEASPVVAPEEAKAPELFGSRGERTAKRVVYVIDASGPMVAALPTVVRELERSIQHLSPDCWVQALVFKEGGYATAPGLDRDSLVKATDANKRGLIRWLATVRADRRGDPLPAIERAVTYRPDVIFLVSKGLSDASLPPAQAATRRDLIVSRLAALNPASGTRGQRPVSIKVIQFFDQDPGGLMHSIGQTHGGADGYKFISRKDLGLE